MKKIYVLATVLLLGASSQAQQTIDFESVILTTESSDNGSSGAGDFLLGTDQVRFSNNYDATFGSWSGFAISNVTDVTTSGWTNQYASFTGSGFAASENFAVGYSVGQITCENQYQFIESFKITNSTYAALSMRDGDGYGKQFGSPNDGAGAPDGTNGEDFYRVWVICEDYSGANKDSVEVLLADYRFADDTQDYIVEEWLDVDLQSIPFQVNNIEFHLESSDNDPTWGIKTPTYYVIDNVVTAFPLGLAENELLAISAYPNPVQDFLKVEGETGLLVLTDLKGTVILSKEHNEISNLDLSDLRSGVYILSVTNGYGKFAQKIVK